MCRGSIVFLLHRPFDANIGRNEKLRSRCSALQDDGWSVECVCVTLSSLFYVFSVNCDVFVSMSNPMWLHFVGMVFKLLKGGDVYWIVEYRDKINRNHFFSVFNSLFFRLCDSVFVIRGVQSDMVGDKVRLLPFIGTDLDYVDGILPCKFDVPVFVYAGHFYEGITEPYVMFDWFKEELDNGVEAKLVVLSNSWISDYDSYIRDIGISDCVEVIAFLPRDEYFAVLKGASKLVYIDLCLGYTSGIYYTKMFDYLAVGVPIVYLSGFGVVEDAFDIGRCDRKVHDKAFVDEVNFIVEV